MNHELQSKIMEYLQSLEDGIGKAGTFVEAEFPLVIQEYLAWVVIRQSVFAAVLLALASLVVVVSRAMWKSIPTHERAEGINAVIVCFSIAISLTIGGAVAAGYAVKAKIAPRVTVLEKVQELLTAGNKQ